MKARSRIQFVGPFLGILAAVGDLGFDISDGVGFDIVAFGSGNVAYATLTVGGIVGLYTMVLETGAAGSSATSSAIRPSSR